MSLNLFNLVFFALQCLSFAPTHLLCPPPCWPQVAFSFHILSIHERCISVSWIYIGEELFSSSSALVQMSLLCIQIPNIYICPGVNVQTIPKSPYFPYVCSQFDICLDFVLRESLSVTVFDSCYHSHHYAGPDFFETFWMQHSLNSFPSLSSYFQSFSSPPSTPTPPSISRPSSSPMPLSSTIIH